MDDFEATTDDGYELCGNIPKLGKLAFKVFYKELLCRATPSTINFVRESIDNHLIGTVKKDVR